MRGSSTSQRRLCPSSLVTTWTTHSSLFPTTWSMSRFAIGSKPLTVTSVRSRNTGLISTISQVPQPTCCWKLGNLISSLFVPPVFHFCVIFQQKEQSGKSKGRVLPQREALHVVHRASPLLQEIQAERHPAPGLLSASHVSWYESG